MKVTGCNNCPFKYSKYDPNTIGCDTIDICVLADFLKFEDSFIIAYDMVVGDLPFDDDPPMWCPLRLQPIKIFYE